MSRPIRRSEDSAESTSYARRTWSVKLLTGPLMNKAANATTIVVMLIVMISSMSVKPAVCALMIVKNCRGMR